MRLVQLPNENIKDYEVIQFNNGRLIQYPNSTKWRVDLLVDGTYYCVSTCSSRQRAQSTYLKKLNELRGVKTEKLNDGLKDCRTCNERLPKLRKGLCPKCDATHGR